MKLKIDKDSETETPVMSKGSKETKKKSVKSNKKTNITEATTVDMMKKPRTRSVSLTLSENGINEDLQQIPYKKNVSQVKQSIKKRPKSTKNDMPSHLSGKKSETSADDDTEHIPEEHIAGRFSNFPIREKTIVKLKAKGINYLFPIQVQTFQQVLEGKDVIAKARTGTGKTMAFALPLVEKLETEAHKPCRGRPPRVIVLAPTRELVNQVAKDFKALSTSLNIHAFYGGVSFYEQRDALRNGIDVLVGTPGRVLDWVNRDEKIHLDTSKLEHVVLDEVDQMLDMGFAEDVENIISHSYKKDAGEQNPQTLFFSATLPRWVTDTAKRYMPVMPAVIDLVGNSVNQTATNVTHLAIRCNYWKEKASYISKIIQFYSGDNGRAMVFCTTKSNVDELAMCPEIKLKTEKLHGDVKQATRESVLEQFRAGAVKVLITTNVAARGLDIPEVDLVIQTEPPTDIESYIHRSGRTGRAGKSGISICLYKYQNEADLIRLERFAKISFKRVNLPSNEELLTRGLRELASVMEELADDVIATFEKTAEELIDQHGAIKTVSALMAIATGNTSVQKCSLINSREGFVTYLYSTNATIKFKSYIYSLIKNRCGQETANLVKHVTLTNDMKGAAFDLPVGSVSKLESSLLFRNAQDSIVKAAKLPPLQSYQTAGEQVSFTSKSPRQHNRGKGQYQHSKDRRQAKRSYSYNSGHSTTSGPPNKKIKFD